MKRILIGLIWVVSGCQLLDGGESPPVVVGGVAVDGRTVVGPGGLSGGGGGGSVRWPEGEIEVPPGGHPVVVEGVPTFVVLRALSRSIAGLETLWTGDLSALVTGDWSLRNYSDLVDFLVFLADINGRSLEIDKHRFRFVGGGGPQGYEGEGEEGSGAVAISGGGAVSWWIGRSDLPESALELVALARRLECDREVGVLVCAGGYGDILGLEEALRAAERAPKPFWKVVPETEGLGDLVDALGWTGIVDVVKVGDSQLVVSASETAIEDVLAVATRSVEEGCVRRVFVPGIAVDDILDSLGEIDEKAWCVEPAAFGAEVVISVRAEWLEYVESLIRAIERGELSAYGLIVVVEKKGGWDVGVEQNLFAFDGGMPSVNWNLDRDYSVRHLGVALRGGESVSVGVTESRQIVGDVALGNGGVLQQSVGQSGDSRRIGRDGLVPAAGRG